MITFIIVKFYFGNVVRKFETVTLIHRLVKTWVLLVKNFMYFSEEINEEQGKRGT